MKKMSASQRMSEYRDLAKSKIPFDQAKSAQLAAMMAQKGELIKRDEKGEVDATATDPLVKKKRTIQRKKYKILYQPSNPLNFQGLR